MSNTLWIDPFEAGADASSSASGYGGGIGLSPDGRIFAYSQGAYLGLWDWPSRRLISQWKLPTPNHLADQIGFSHNGDLLGVALYFDNGRNTLIYRLSDLITNS